MTRRRVGNPLALAVLSCLSERPMHPYEISTTLRSRGKEQSIKLNYGALYSVVDSLQKHGLIASPEPTREGPPGAHRLRDYRARADRARGLVGRIAVHARARVHVAGGRAVVDGRPAAGRGCAVARHAHRQAAHRTALARIGRRDRRRDGLPELFSVESRYRHAILTAELAFVTNVVERIRDSSFGGTKVWRRMHELMAAGMTFEELLADPVRHLGEEARILQQQPNP